MGDKVNQAALVNLRRKYGDDALLDQIRDVFIQRHSAVVRGAKRFANAVKARYAQTTTPYSIILQKVVLMPENTNYLKLNSLNSKEFTNKN